MALHLLVTPRLHQGLQRVGLELRWRLDHRLSGHEDDIRQGTAQPPQQCQISASARVRP